MNRAFCCWDRKLGKGKWVVLGWLSWLLPAGHLCFCGWLLEDGQGFYFAGSEVDRGLDRSVLCSGELGVRPHWIQRAFLCPASDRQLETHISKSTENTRTHKVRTE